MTKKHKKTKKISKRQRQYLLEQYLEAYKGTIQDALGYFIDGNATKVHEKEQEAAYWREKRIAIRRGYELSRDHHNTRRGSLLDVLMARKMEIAIKTAVSASKSPLTPVLAYLYPDSINLPL